MRRWFWGTAWWQEYSDAYGGGHEGNDGPNGNLVIALGPERGMWGGIRKGHRAAIRSAQGRLMTSRYPSGLSRFEEYRELHRSQHGNVRAERTFELMRQWLDDGLAWLLLARPLEGDPAAVAAALFIVYERQAYYASAARDVRRNAPGAAHLLMWTAMRSLLMFGVGSLDLGPVCGPEASEKALAVEHFKRGFGPEMVKW